MLEPNTFAPFAPPNPPNGDEAGVVEPNALGLPELLPNPEKADFGASLG